MDNDLAKYGAIPVGEPAQDDVNIEAFGGEAISPERALYLEEQSKYGGTGAAALATAAGAARGLSFGLSDVILKGMGLSEEAAKLQAHQPTMSTVGEVGGAIGGAFLGPGAIVAKGAQAATKGIVSGLGRAAAKEAAEGALYGVGQTISEQALGTNDSVAESLVANVGMGAILGGGFGMAAHGASEGAQAMSRQVKKFLKGEGAVNKWLGKADEFFTGEAGKVASDLEELKKLSEIEGVPLTPGMLSESPIIRGIESHLEQAPTTFGGYVREGTQPTYKAMQKQTAKIVEEASKDTLENVGDEIKSTLISRVHQLHDPASAAYKEIAEHTKNIEVTPDMRASLVKKLDEWGFANTNIGTEGRQAVEFAIKNFSQDIYMPIDKIKDIASDLGGMAAKADPKQKIKINILKDKVDQFYERQIRRSAIENAMSKPDGEEIARQLIGDIKGAKKGWREFREFMDEVGSEAGLGKRKIKSIGDFLDRIESIDNAKLSSNLFNKKSIKSLKFVNENFPEIFDKLRRIEIAKMSAAADAVDPMGNTITDILKLKKYTEKYSPEALEMILGKDKIKSIDNLEKLRQKMPKKLGPSGTPEGLRYFNLLKPAMWANDAAAYAIYSGGKIAMDVGDKQTKVLSSRLKNFVTQAKKPIVGASTVAITAGTRDYEQRLKDIEETALDPQKYIDKIIENTAGLSNIDPDLQTSISNTALQAVNFLQDKAPKNPFAGSMVISPLKWKPSDAELSKFNRYLKAIDDPFSVLDDLDQGMLTPESVEALKAVYPNLYSKMSQMAVEAVGEHQDGLPFVKQLQLSMLLGMPVSSAQDQNFVMRLQAGAQAQGAAEEMQNQPKAARKGGKIEGDFLKNQMGQSEQLTRSRGQ